MIGPSGAVRVMLATRPVDFRKGMDGLAALVRDAMGADPFSGTVYVFRSKRADRVKLLVWDGSGLVLAAKRLEAGGFCWPKIEDGVVRLIEGGLPTDALVAQVLVSKYADHLPLYRQAQIFARQGVVLDRSTLADWVGRAAFLLRPVHARLLETLKRSGKLFADETTAPVLDPGRGRTKTGQLWAYARDDRPWGGSDPPRVAYVYAPDRTASRPIAHLAGFEGVLQVDGYAAYEVLAKGGAIRLAYCWTRDLQAKIGRARHQLLVFLAHSGAVEPTNNGSERLLRPSVVQRKVTNGYRAMWAAEGEAAIRTVVDTARLAGSSPFGTILKTVSA